MFARVAFPLALPEALSYAVPADLEPITVPGVRVRARLRGVARVGLVLELTDDPGCELSRVMPIDETLDPEPLVPPAVLSLIAFAADYYVAPVGLVARAAVPTQLLRLPTPLVHVGPRAREVLTSAGPDERRLLERVLAAGRVSLARLRVEGWSLDMLRSTLAVLAARHAVRVDDRVPSTTPGGSVAAVALAGLDAVERERRVGRAPAQGRVVAYLEELDRPVLEGELREACGCSGGVVAELVRKGVLRRFQQGRQGLPRRWELAPPARPERLTSHQEHVLGSLLKEIGGGEYRATLLLGVTGSGKTEVYLRLAVAAATRGLQTLIMVPEIGLTPALAGLLSARFGERVAVLHSSMAEGERFAAWERARRGEVDVVAGPRSALWAPLRRLGAVVVDEEQDHSYKQEEDPRYNARDLALVLARQQRVPVVLASATPALDTLALAAQGRLRVLELPERVSGNRLPAVEVVDLRGEEGEPGEHGQRFLSRRLRELLAGVLERGEQAILLVNRRGWAPVLLCRDCGHQAACPDCSIPMTVHRRRGALLCHYCGHRREIPNVCARCGGAVLDHVGAGTEKIATKVRELHPAARVDILDRDTARSPAQLVGTLERFATGGSDVLVGTQMVSKGHHFPNVTLTGVVNADNLLGFPDFRGAERTFQMLTQVAGRAGRGDRPGVVVIQSYHPDHHAIRAAVTQDAKAFAEEEMRYRRAFGYPPFARVALVRFESASENAAQAAAHAAAGALEPRAEGLRVLGPAPSPVVRLRGKWRFQLMLLAATRAPIREALGRVVATSVPNHVRRVVDVDPQSTV